MQSIDPSTQAGRWLVAISKSYMKRTPPGPVRLRGMPVSGWFAKTRLLLNDGITVAIQPHSFKAAIWHMDLFVASFMKDDE